MSRGPGDQAQRVVMGAEEGEMGGAGEGGSHKVEGMHFHGEDVRFRVTF